MIEDIEWGSVSHVYQDSKGQLKAIFGKDLKRDRPAQRMAYYIVDIDPEYFWKDSMYLFTWDLSSGVGAVRGVTDFIVDVDDSIYYPMGLEYDVNSFYEGLLFSAHDSEGNILWKHTERSIGELWRDSMNQFPNRIEIINHKECQNGDILYMGIAVFAYRGTSLDVDHPFAMRVSPNGTIKWMRAYYKLNDDGMPYGSQFR
jgi:hypothetical protein